MLIIYEESAIEERRDDYRVCKGILKSKLHYLTRHSINFKELM